MSTTHGRYAVRRTLDVRPERWGTLAGEDYGRADNLEDAVAIAARQGRLGYPSRVVDTLTEDCVWARGRYLTMTQSDALRRGETWTSSR
jgi:hypothetical protein